ncbi:MULTISPECIES: ABC transporter permease [Aerococcus]|uniref:Iron export ABC transporter permease subunit FetB n=1 Tax=Aerococcus loyolae TaxID=2976809 RepID=A0ABT4BXT2_9LACT|nr:MULTISPECIES: iron export ABC transporter permease subunit FetB [Aerococcus]KAA9220663.1 iron export ABC transporter permease subunit FetB [Aerococcus loyolae]KAA9265383.1 iron export ABC transporter permease subunit FetB [Aerococcus loyolae]MCY3025077.1 iron export ABC transporter permease subunit FetB [Aerococcus loyolae]MCY3028019.1 iron export ABC transporter permease subunit FetB [Aerococcus loyolae]MCY3028451.1 iron export ABC transporter permease subunit FetB [Aerococcus loyolae]
MENVSMTPIALAFSFSLVLISLAISYFNQLKLEKAILTAGIRIVIQLSIAALIFQFIFTKDNFYLSALLLLIMLVIAAWNASKRGGQIKGRFWIALVTLMVTEGVTLFVFVGSGAVQWTPSQVIPISGMIIGNAMNAVGLVFSDLLTYFSDQSQAILERLALGATPRQASQGLIRQTIADGMIPTIDGAKTTGIVTLPGMMMGLLFAGVDPMTAVLYQSIVMFMTLSTAAITTFVSSLLTYRKFFTDRDLLIRRHSSDK